MKTKKKRILILAVVVIAAALWTWRYVTLNQYYKSIASKRVYYRLEETVELGNNIIDKIPTANGYSLTFHSCEVLSLDELAEKYEVSSEVMERLTDVPDYAVVVSVTAYNEDNTDGSIPFYYLNLHSVDWYTDWNGELMALLNDVGEEGWNMDYTCEPGTSDDFYLVFNINHVGVRVSDKRWASIAEEPLWLQLTYGPEKIEVVLQE